MHSQNDDPMKFANSCFYAFWPSCFLTIIFLFFTTEAQTTLSGRVTDWNGNGVPYAKVKLANVKLQTETDLSGYFTKDDIVIT